MSPQESAAYAWIALEEGDLPGEILFDHPDDARPNADERLWEILQLIQPHGDIVTAGIPGPWGAPFNAQRLEEARATCIEQVAQQEEEPSSRGVSILTREYRVERR